MGVYILLGLIIILILITLFMMGRDVKTPRQHNPITFYDHECDNDCDDNDCDDNDGDGGCDGDCGE